MSDTRLQERGQLVRTPISGETKVKSSYESVASLFHSPDRLWRLTPGCERIEKIGADTYSGWMRFGIPGIIGSYIGVLRLHYYSAHHYGMSVKATRANGTGSVDATGNIRLVEVNSDSTLLRYSGEIQVSLPSSVLGTRVIRGFARLLLGQFFAAVEAELEAERSGTVARHGLLRNLCRYVARSISRS